MSPKPRAIIISPETLTAEEREDLKAFLASLTDQTLLTNPDFSDPFEG